MTLHLKEIVQKITVLNLYLKNISCRHARHLLRLNIYAKLLVSSSWGEQRLDLRETNVPCGIAAITRRFPREQDGNLHRRSGCPSRGGVLREYHYKNLARAVHWMEDLARESRKIVRDEQRRRETDCTQFWRPCSIVCVYVNVKISPTMQQRSILFFSVDHNINNFQTQ